ncbi:hypothetical protein CPAR01_12502 [Colletotrichum paranaense]|uniref:Uncharacterized protein n=1 Tax=Colletotrichum paranaense TaxID=1914294 RepID=A0ABQ9S6K8_9PEZI|nr:uncharacterized protein CPAR01_12502 [Colletotrichum paranaense]KAK1527944.1 hypothetical protein CPAR01_12502 [Colletotrichum paranaense]
MIPQQRQTRLTQSCLEALTLSLEEPDTQAELGLEARPRTRAGWRSALATPNPSKARQAASSQAGSPSL